MNWKFWQKDEPALRHFEIPADKVQEIKRLLDVHNSLPGGQDFESHYVLWQAISKVIPETKQGLWTLKQPTALTAEVVERFEM